MIQVPIFTYLHKNTFGIVTESYKPHIHTYIVSAGLGTMTIVALRVGMIVIAVCLILLLVGFISSSRKESDRRRQEEITAKLEADAARAGLIKL